MTTQNKLVDLKPEDWLLLYVDVELKAFSKKFGGTFDTSDVEVVCKLVADRKLPEGVDLYVALNLSMCKDKNVRELVDRDLGVDLSCSIAHGLKLGQDVLIYLYSRYCELEGYNEHVAHIFKQSLNYTIPF